jgi:fatty-acid desaturase
MAETSRPVPTRRRVLLMVGLHTLNAILLIVAVVVVYRQDAPTWTIVLILLVIAWQITKLAFAIGLYRSRKDSRTM